MKHTPNIEFTHNSILFVPCSFQYIPFIIIFIKTRMFKGNILKYDQQNPLFLAINCGISPSLMIQESYYRGWTGHPFVRCLVQPIRSVRGRERSRCCVTRGMNIYSALLVVRRAHDHKTHAPHHLVYGMVFFLDTFASNDTAVYCSYHTRGPAPFLAHLLVPSKHIHPVIQLVFHTNGK